MQRFNTPATYALLVTLITILVNVGLAYSGTTQKLSCTLEQTAAVAAAVHSASSTQ